MVDIIILIFILVVLAFAIVRFGFVKEQRLTIPAKKHLGKTSPVFERPNTKGLNCRVELERLGKNGSFKDSFAVEICGAIHAPDGINHLMANISVEDITDENSNAQPIEARVTSREIIDSSHTFCYQADLGKVPNQDISLSEWMTIAHIDSDWMRLPRKGKRNLRFEVSIISGDNSSELSCTDCTFEYDNPAFGYIDVQENAWRTKSLAVALGFAVSAADGRLDECEVEVIRNWAMNNFNLCQASKGARRKLEKELKNTCRFFRAGNQLNTCKICKEIVGIAALSQRYDVLELCLRVAKANGVAASEELELLKNLANWLEVDSDKFRGMTARILPASMHEVEDAEIVLGVSYDMSQEQTRQQLNQEYRKWNSRVTNFDPEIQAQADYMLNLIAETRNEFVER